MSDDELGLVARAREGDPDAFGALVKLHWVRLVRLARSMVGEAGAEDVVQESFVVAWRKLGKLARDEAFRPWVTRIVFRRCLRDRGRQRPVALDAQPAPREAGNPETATWVGELLSRLAPRQRAVMHLTVVEGSTDGEIAGLLGITAASVRTHRRRARARIDALLDEVGKR
jgi:RNA polymerase sigma-70 factor (ECF subfamily)